jgi:hypothetical protein
MKKDFALNVLFYQFLDILLPKDNFTTGLLILLGVGVKTSLAVKHTESKHQRLLNLTVSFFGGQVTKRCAVQY